MRFNIDLTTEDDDQVTVDIENDEFENMFEGVYKEAYIEGFKDGFVASHKRVIQIYKDLFKNKFGADLNETHSNLS